MSGAPLTTPTTAASPPTVLEMFQARVAARAYLYHIGELDLHDAVDALQEHAERHGLMDQCGQDAVQAIISEAFRPARAREAS